ncbi:MAG: hypothetical protein HOQ22_06265 [Nocardioidaceae bacterium]|nr:hypothetical protein [Nocardioidaceae bacterium]NUS50634.1 hypothetical protein [Nocardioidaceae bacterium]
MAVLALAASGAVVADAVTPPPAHQNGTVGYKAVGPIDETNGFPLWYQDTNGVRLELCTDPNDALCIMGDVPNPQAPVSFPDNFPDEAFWSSGEATIDAGGGEKALLVTATEAAFASADGLPAKGQQISFGRIRVRVSGLVDGATYKVTHPYGVDSADAEPGAARGINTTEDVGSLVPDGVFDQTLGARPAPFLKWTGTDAPPGYLGDPNTPHTVTGSPYGTNFFRVEGPAGSFTGSTQLCSDPTLGDSPTATDDCIQTNDFNVQGKIATRGGVQVTKAYYANSGTGHMMDLFAYSTPGQTLIVSGTGISQTKMREDGAGNGRYYARVFADGAPPADLKVTNTSDKPNSVDHVEQSQFGDKVHIGSAVYSNDDHSLRVQAQSGDDTAALKLDGFPAATPTVDANGVSTFSIPNVNVPPADVMVTSNKGGVDSEDVVITGADDPSAQVVATITGDTHDVQVGQAVSLDGLSSVGTITAYDWTLNPATGATLTGTGSARTFTAQSPGTYVVQLKVTGNGAGNTSTDSYTINVFGAAAPPVADAGPDQLGVVPTATVTLDGTASKFASTYSWARNGGTGPAVTLSNANTANPTFVVPSSTTSQTYTFTLTITDVNGTTATDSVTVRSDPGTITVDDAFYKRGGLEWRVRGSAQYCTANNLVSVYWNKPGASPVLLGTASPVADLGVCTYDFRLKNTPTALRPTTAGTVTVRSALGGEVLNRAFNLL